VVCVANFRPRKRQQDLIEAMARVAASGTELDCRFIGDGGTLTEMRERAAAAGLNGRVVFLGRVAPRQLPGLLEEADIAALPSAWEGMSVGMLEAMASGLPVVATDVAGTREVVVDGETGFLVPVARPDLLAERLSTLARDRGLRVRLGQGGRHRVEQQFSLSLNVRRHLDAYQRLAGASGRPRS
jgi:glycosyltransferase involved in cell wall biosynthesis